MADITAVFPFKNTLAFIRLSFFTQGISKGKEMFPEAEETFKQMFTTFKLSNQKVTSALGGNANVYTNSQLGFSFQLRSDYKIESENTKQAVFSGMYGEQVVPSLLFLNFQKTINISSLKSCTNLATETLDNYECIDGSVQPKIYNGNEFITAAIRSGRKNTMASSRYIVQKLTKPQLEFVHMVIGGGVESDMDQILSTFKFTQ